MDIDSITLAAVTGGTVHGPLQLFSGVALDSRKAAPGDLFVAIKGPNHDGHDFVADALVKASGALVSRSIPESALPKDRTLIRVADTLHALRAVARYVKETLRVKVVAITGSVGKTTTKEMAAALLSQKFRVSKTTGNLNNTIGLPAELVRMPEATECAVLEMGMSTPGEIRLLSDLVQPHAACVTAVAPAHIGNFRSLDGVMEAKAEILSGMGRDSVFVANGDDERSVAIGKRHKGKVVTYGLAEGFDVFATGIHEDVTASRFTLHLGRETHAITLPLPGRHNISNFLAASALASSMGVSGRDIAAAAVVLAPVSHRGEVSILANDVLLYDDSYNSSPTGLRAAYAAFEASSKGRRRIAVVGEMLELGRKSDELHHAAGKDLAGRFDVLVAVKGDAAAAGAATLASAARNAGAPPGSIHVVKDVDAAIPLVSSLLLPGDAVFVKGSRGVALDRLVEALS